MQIELTVEQIADVLRGAPISVITDNGKMVMLTRKANLTQEDQDALRLGREMIGAVVRKMP